MENGARPSAGAHWLAAAPPNFRERVIQNIMKSLSRTPEAHEADNLRIHGCASQYETRVFSQSDNAQDYLRTISKKMVRLQEKWLPAVQAASDLRQQQAQMGRQQMRPVDAVLGQTASTIPVPARPPQGQNNHTRVNQAQPAKLPPVAPVVQLHPCHPAVVTQIQTPIPARHNSTQQPRPRMNQQGLRMDQRQSYQTHNGQHANVAIMQTRQCGGQNSQQFGNPHPAGEVDWREDVFQKIASLKVAHLSELVEYGRALQACALRMKANRQLESLPEEQARRFRYAQCTMERIKTVLSFLQLQKTNITEAAKDELGKIQTAIHDLRHSYKAIKARSAEKNAGSQSQNCREPPQAVNISGATDNCQQNHHEQHAAEATSHSSQNVPSGTPLAQQQNHSDHLAGEAEDNMVPGEAESPVAVNPPGDAAPFTGRTCSQEIQQMHPADEAIPQLTQTVEPDGTSPTQQQTHSTHSVRVEAEDDSMQAEAERPVSMEALIKHEVGTERSFSPAALHKLTSDVGVNLKRAFHRMTLDTMEGSSCVWFDDESSGKSSYKRQKTHDGTLMGEIRATDSMLVDTAIRISEEDTGGADGTMIELCYNAVSLSPDLREAICASEMSTKLLIPTDYPGNSPVILSGDGERRKGVPGVVDIAFRRALVLLPEPRSIEGMAKEWDSVVRMAIVQFAHRFRGGMFSTRYGQWRSCIPA